ncbi:MAG: GNAT family N-acetyltransferase [Tissierellia bacterium]|nr:GNAT family N-acetyltransferase [Tissierellia bacterium]
MNIVPLEVAHVYDFLQWTPHEDPLYGMFNFVETRETVPEWYAWKTASIFDTYFAIVVDDFAVGYMGLKGMNPLLRRGEIGIILDRAQMDRGYGRRALTWLLDYGFQKRHLERISLSVYPWNHRALHLYESLGFQPIRQREQLISNRWVRQMGPALDPYREFLVPRGGQWRLLETVMVLKRKDWSDI